MKQSFDYDCGHVCLRDHGVDPPNLCRALKGVEVVSALGQDSDLIICTDFQHEGIYMLAAGLDDEAHAHWVSYRNGKVLDPVDGRRHTADFIKTRYATQGHFIIGAVVPGAALWTA